MPKTTLAFFSFASLLVTAAPALADEAPPDTSNARGSPPMHVLVDDLIGLRTDPIAPGVAGAPFTQSGIVSYSSGRSGDMHTTRWTISPSLDATLGEHVTFGGSVAVTRSLQRFDGLASGPDSSAWSVAVIPRIGYLAKVNESLFIWPRLGMGFGTGDASTEPLSGLGGIGGVGGAGVGALGAVGGSTQTSYDAWIAKAELLATARLLDHFLISLGPEATLQVSHTSVSPGLELSSTTFRVGGRLSMGLVF